ncbi:MAG: pyridoxal phosphate-dependent aminotransferase [Planctomycetota bacterium]
MQFNPMIETSKFWTLRGNPALVSGRKLKKDNVEFVHQGTKHGVLFWNIGDTHTEKDIIIPAMVQEAIHRAVESERICYTFSEGDPALLKGIAKRYGVSDTEIFVTNGVTEGILFLGRMFAQIAGSCENAKLLAIQDNWPNLILVNPVYPPWRGIMMEYGLKVELADRYAEGRLKGQVNIDRIKEKVNKGTLGVVLIPADNPTGKILTKENVEGVAALVREMNHHKQEMFLIVDNVYEEFINPEDRIDYIKLSDRYKIPLILMGGIDKVLGTGLHGGWMIDHIPEDCAKLRRETLEVMRLLFSKYTGANTITQYAMMPYFSNYEMVLVDIKKNIDKFHEWCNKFIKELRKTDDKYLKLKYGAPELPLYIWLEIVPRNVWGNATTFADDLVKTTGVLVAPGDPFGDNNCIRISVVRDPLKPLNIPEIIIDFMKKRMENKK